jgi:YVTN family beta-propeller protein
MIIATTFVATAARAQDPHAGHAPPDPYAGHSPPAAPPAVTAGPPAGHPMPAQPASSPASTAHAGHEAAADEANAPVRMLRAAIDVHPVTRPRGEAPRQGEEVELRLRLTDPATGRPERGLNPSAWVDVRRQAGPTPLGECQQRVGSLNQSSMMIKHGQISMATPVEDLNGHYVAVLAKSPEIAVLDPIKGFGRTMLFAAVTLPGRGADWAATPDDRLLLVAVPDSGLLAVVDTHEWKVQASVRVGGRPAKVGVDPAGRFAWVVGDGAHPEAVRVDLNTLAVAGRFPVGAGPHFLAFSGDGSFVFVTNRAAGTVTVVDAAAPRVAATVHTGDAPVDVAWSARVRAAFVANQGDGTVTVVDPARGAAVGRITFTPGIRTIRFAPEADPHAGHSMAMGDEGDQLAPGGRLAFVLNPAAGTMDIYDVVARRLVRTLSGSPQADQIAFTAQFAYVRAAGTPSVAMIPLSAPTGGAMGPHDYFPAGDQAPGAVGDSLGDVLIAQPGMHDAVYVANPAEHMIYGYHYMEGMPVPHDGLTTYGFVPRAIRTVSRRLRETEPGVYAATLRLEDAGDYDLVLRSASPHVVGCYGFSIAPDPARAARAALRVEPADAGGTLPIGRAAVRFRVTAGTGAPVDGIDDLRVTLASTEGWLQRVVATGAGGGVYVAEFEVPREGLYVAAVDIPSRGVPSNAHAPVYLRAGR